MAGLLLLAYPNPVTPGGCKASPQAAFPILAATTDNPFFDDHLGSVEDFAPKLRGWAEACGADSSNVVGLIHSPGV